MLIINFEVRSKKFPCKLLKNKIHLKFFSILAKILHSKLNLIDLAGSENV